MTNTLKIIYKRYARTLQGEIVKMEIFCGNYKDRGNIEVEDGVTKRVIWVELYCDTTPSNLTIAPQDVTGLPKICDFSEMQFAPGSALVAVSDDKVYLCDTDGEFIEF